MLHPPGEIGHPPMRAVVTVEFEYNLPPKAKIVSCPNTAYRKSSDLDSIFGVFRIVHYITQWAGIPLCSVFPPPPPLQTFPSSNPEFILFTASRRDKYETGGWKACEERVEEIWDVMTSLDVHIYSDGRVVVEPGR